MRLLTSYSGDQLDSLLGGEGVHGVGQKWESAEQVG